MHALLNIARHLTALVLVAMLPLTAHAAAQPECGPDVTCDKLDACQAFEAYRIPFATIKQCIASGTPPPERWLNLGGQGSVNLGGRGNVVRGDLESPFFPMPSDGTLNTGGGLPSGGDILGAIKKMLGDKNNWQSGPATKNPPDCSSYKSPYLREAGELMGEQVSLSAAAGARCGSAVQTAHDWAIFTRNATHAAISVPATNQLQVFQKSGANLVHQANVQIPNFFCVIRPCSEDPSNPACASRGGGDDNGGGGNSPEVYAKPIPITVIKHYAELASYSKTVPISAGLADADTPFAFEDVFILMTRSGITAFNPPKPDPEYFTAQGAYDVDPNCYSFDRLFTEAIPKDVGDMMVGRSPDGDYDSQIIRPQTYLAESDEGTCRPFLQYYNSFQPSIYTPPGVAMSNGKITGGAPYSATTVQFGSGVMRAGADGVEYFSGSFLTVPKAKIYLSGIAGGTNIQQFPAGATFTLDETRRLRVNPHGRIKLTSDHRMQIIDGGRVEDNTASIIGEVAPMGFVQFNKDNVIIGSADHAMVPQNTTTIPTNPTNTAQLPYDSRLDLICEELNAGVTP